MIFILLFFIAEIALLPYTNGVLDNEPTQAERAEIETLRHLIAVAKWQALYDSRYEVKVASLQKRLEQLEKVRDLPDMPSLPGSLEEKLNKMKTALRQAVAKLHKALYNRQALEEKIGKMELINRRLLRKLRYCSQRKLQQKKGPKYCKQIPNLPDKTLYPPTGFRLAPSAYIKGNRLRKFVTYKTFTCTDMPTYRKPFFKLVTIAKKKSKDGRLSFGSVTNVEYYSPKWHRFNWVPDLQSYDRSKSKIRDGKSEKAWNRFVKWPKWDTADKLRYDEGREDLKEGALDYQDEGEYNESEREEEDSEWGREPVDDREEEREVLDDDDEDDDDDDDDEREDEENENREMGDEEDLDVNEGMIGMDNDMDDVLETRNMTEPKIDLTIRKRSSKHN